jgi:hypothetical protein
LKKKYKIILFTSLGAILGFLYYFFIGCRSGSCPITSNGYISSLYGAVFGLILGWDTKKNSKENEIEGKSDSE